MQLFAQFFMLVLMMWSSIEYSEIDFFHVAIVTRRHQLHHPRISLGFKMTAILEDSNLPSDVRLPDLLECYGRLFQMLAAA